ncbi:MAG: molybdopterin-dependent oxidoreductase, partial [Acidobacteriota bacterium]
MKMRKEPKDRRRDCSGEHLHDWEDFYRERSNPDRIIAGTHGVPCGAGCTMLIEVKDGIIISERPAALPTRQDGIQASPGRCCACGLTGSDYLYSSSRVSTPLIRKTLLDDWRATRSQHENPVEAWGALVNRPDRRRRWQRARGKGGFVPVTWDVATELICSSLLHTIEQKGPNHVYGSASSPGSSMVSYASGSRFLQLLGGVTLGSGDREQGICNAAALTWGEQGDVPEAAAWFEAQLLVVLGEEFQAAAPADHGVLIEAQQRGSTLWVIAQEYDLLARNADNWLELNASETATLWAAINHVILTEFFGNQAELQFTDYVSRFTDGPLLVELSRSSDGYTVGGLLNSDRIQQLQSQERTGSGFLVWDGTTESPRKVTGTRSDRLSGREGAWNLKPANSEEQAMDPLLSIGARPATAVWVQIGSEDGWSLADGEVPTFELKSSQGEPIIVTTVFDLLMARYGVLRRPASTEGIADNTRDEYLERASQITGTEPLRLRALAREFARSAIDSKGKCTILTSPAFTGQDGSQSALNAAIDALLLCGCPGAVGGGFGFYSGFSRTSLNDAWSPLAFATDWIDSPRTMPAQAWHASHGSLQPFPDDHHWDSASPAVWLIWNGDALSANATGHEYDLLHLLGTHSTVVSQESPGAGPDQAGLLDLIVTLNFRLDTSAFYSDLILPATTWYEKEDLNSALTHPFIQPIR